MFIVYLSPYLSSLYLAGHHECEILSGGPEAAESEYLWKKCKKNPGHEEFISAKDFKDNFLPKVHTDKQHDRLRAVIDLTVRLRVSWTSAERPDDYPFSNVRGTNRTRLGTGLIDSVSDSVTDEPCPCVEYNREKTRKFWRFRVRTAAHVVYNTEEAKSTKVDLFYDDDSCKLDDRMATVTGLEEIHLEIDICYRNGVTHDEVLVQRIESARSCWCGSREVVDLSGLDFLLSCDEGRHPTLIVSHPHGQPKKITLGQARDEEFLLANYNVATCPGSSGAPVLWLHTHPDGMRYHLSYLPVHSGSFSFSAEEQCNFGHWY